MQQKIIKKEELRVTGFGHKHEIQILNTNRKCKYKIPIRNTLKKEEIRKQLLGAERRRPWSV